ncbi:MAG: NAD-dependent deacylase [Bellilinea sp.]|nr:MAG: NAD-dependent deacylase [Bellilinea sp.]
MTTLSMAEAAQQAAELISKSKWMVVLTGAGISTPSGIPDFRSPNTGLWSRSDPMEVASLSAFQFHPEKFYNWLRPLAREMIKALPNAAHFALAKLEEKGVLKAVITQNIDGLHQKAGSKEVYEVHGSMQRLNCLSCRKNYPLQDFLGLFNSPQDIPRCPNCCAILKPDIVLFEELLPADVWNQAEQTSTKADLFVVIGSALEVTPAAHLPLYALENGARLIINTFSSTYLNSRADLLLPFDVAQIWPEIVARLD